MENALETPAAQSIRIWCDWVFAQVQDHEMKLLLFFGFILCVVISIF